MFLSCVNPGFVDGYSKYRKHWKWAALQNEEGEIFGHLNYVTHFFVEGMGRLSFDVQ